jgi:hypothetical protein
MNRKKLTCCRAYLLLTVCCLLQFISFATAPGDSIQPRKQIPAVFSSPATAAAQPEFAALDAAIARQGFNTQQTTNEMNAAWFSAQNSFSDSVMSMYREKAKTTLGLLDASQHYVNYLTPADLQQLPVGFRQQAGNATVTIAVGSILTNARYAELTVYAQVEIPQAPYKIFFGISGLKLSNSGGIIGDAKLVLLGDVAIPINGRSAALVLKGGINMATGQALDKTFLTINCDGFKELGIAADVLFPRSLLTPVDETGKELPDPGTKVKGSFQTIVSNWNDILASFSLSPFSIKGLSGITFNVNTAVFDFSDLRNSGDIVYPPGYEQKYLPSVAPGTWRGVYAKNISVQLPAAFKDRSSSARVSFGVNDLLIDNNGLSGLFYAENVLPIDKGSAGGWKFSVDSIRLGIEANQLLRAGFGGRLGLPLSKEKTLGYGAVISNSGDYVLTVSSIDSISFDIWKAKTVLLPNSWVKLQLQNDRFLPEAWLNGKMGIAITKANADSTNEKERPLAELSGVQFSGLHLRSVAPYIEVAAMGYDGEVKFANFPLSIDSIGVMTRNGGTEAGLYFRANIELQEGAFKGSTALTVIGSLNQTQGIQSWTYKKIELSEIAISAALGGGFELDGRIRFMNDDYIYGDGFAGNLRAKFGVKDNFVVDVSAVFGKKAFRYWYIDGKAAFNPAFGGPGFAIDGFGGGAWYRMRRDGFSNTLSPNGFKFTPDENAGLGVRAAMSFSFGKKAASGEASFEMAFNRGGGVRYIGLFAFAKMMTTIPGLSDLQRLTKNIQRIEYKTDSTLRSGMSSEDLHRLRMYQPVEAAAKTSPSDEKPGVQGLSAYAGILFNFEQKTFDASFDLFINAANGLVRGSGANNRAGWARLHIAPNKWYLHVGNPSDRVGVRVGIGSVGITTGAYFMVGHDIPSPPPPPQQVLQYIGNNYLGQTFASGTDSLKTGKGLAMGMNIAMSTGDLRFLVFYARFDAGLGFDVMVRDLGKTRCAGRSGLIGFDGWYVQGQAYAYVAGDIGLLVKLSFVQKKISILKIGVGVLLQADFPNPSWFRGYVGGEYSILNGLVKGRCNFRMQIGERCEMYQDGEFESKSVITSISPDSAATNVSVLSAPLAALNMRIGEELDETGEGVVKYRVKLDYFTLTKGGQPVAGRTEVLENGGLVEYIPAARLAPMTAYRAAVQLYFEKWENGYWSVIKKADGSRLNDRREFDFTTGQNPDTLNRENIRYTWPLAGQQNFYRAETTNGFIQLIYPQPNLFGYFNTWYARFTGLDGKSIESPAAYNKVNNRIDFAIPGELENGRTYTLEIRGRMTRGDVPVYQPGYTPVALSSSEETPAESDVSILDVKTGGTILEEAQRPLVSFSFRVSNHNSFADKISSLQIQQAITGRISSDVIDLQAKVNSYEGFDLYELKGRALFSGHTAAVVAPLVKAEALLDDNYYKGSIQPVIYPTAPSAAGISGGGLTFTLTGRNPSILGEPPVRAIKPLPYYISCLENQQMTGFLNQRFPWSYSLVETYNGDWQDLRSQVVNYSVSHNQPALLSQFPVLVNSPFPFMEAGKYHVKFRFTLPDGTPGSSAIFTFRNDLQ